MSQAKKPLELTAGAIREYLGALAYIHRQSPASAELVRKRIEKAFDLVEKNPEIGTPGFLKGTRDWPIARTSVILSYKVMRDRIRVFRVRHERREYP